MNKKIITIGTAAIFIGTFFLSCVNAQTVRNNDTTPPIVSISQPGNAIYIMGIRTIPFVRPIIIGSIQIWFWAEDDESGLNRIEIYIDYDLKASFTTVPKSWLWCEITPITLRHKLQLIAYDNAGNNATFELNVWKFF